MILQGFPVLTRVNDEPFIIVRKRTRLYNKLYEIGKLYTVDDLTDSDYTIEEVFVDSLKFAATAGSIGDLMSLSPFVWIEIFLNSSLSGRGTLLCKNGLMYIKFLSPP